MLAAAVKMAADPCYGSIVRAAAGDGGTTGAWPATARDRAGDDDHASPRASATEAVRRAARGRRRPSDFAQLTTQDADPLRMRRCVDARADVLDLRHRQCAQRFRRPRVPNRITVVNRVATVDVSRRYEDGGGSTSMLLRVAQVVYTAARFPTVRKVAVRIAGRPVTAVGGERVVVSPPVGRAEFEAQTPPILVEQPLPGTS
jgi:hypothetical protein